MKKKQVTAAVSAPRRANTMMRKRVMILALVFGMLTFLVLFVKLWTIQIRDHDRYEEEAINRQTGDRTVSASRGKITDAKGANLAISATVHNVIISPKDIAEDELDEQLIVDNLYRMLKDQGADKEKMLKALENKKSGYYVVARKIEEEKSKEVRAFIDEQKIKRGVTLQADSKRYYPRSSLAAQVIGFVNSDNAGAYGLEEMYNSALAGQTGRVVTARAGNGVEMPSAYEAYIDAQSGNNVQLTLDANIQAMAQRAVEEGIERFEVLEGATCIVMNPKTGAIYAMVSNPDYDINSYSSIKDPMMQAELDALLAEAERLLAKEQGVEGFDGLPVFGLNGKVIGTVGQPLGGNTAPTEGTADKEPDPDAAEPEPTPGEQKMAQYQKELSNARNRQWRSKALNDAYEPGSTFKPLVVSMAIEEGLVSADETFYCGGSMMIDGWDEPINCHYRRGHGTQTVEKVLMNSCNPGMMQIAQKIGHEKFYEYYTDYGFREKTGVDMQGEVVGVFWDWEGFRSRPSDLAVASFGQRFIITPISLIRAHAALINGGHLLEPYVVQSVTDSEGNLLSYREPKEVRQVVSQETSDLLRSFMASCVAGGGANNARVPGYSIGGKTGTSQTVNSDITGRLVTSFVGFAPVEDPEVIVLLAFDHPKPTRPGSNVTAGNYYISGNSMAAMLAGPLIADILDYMGTPNASTELARDVSMPNLKGKTLEEAQAALTRAGLTWKLVGNGATVTDQTPRSGVAIPTGSAGVLYLGAQKSDSKVAVPNVVGRTYNDAKKILGDRGLYLKAPGIENSSKMVAFSQATDPGVEVDAGTVIEVRFRDNSIQYYTD